MKRLSVSVVSVILMLVLAGSAFGEREDFTSIELTEDQISIIVHNCPQDGEITIELTEDQIAIIVHNFPRAEIRELTLGREHISDDNIVELAPAGRTGIAPVETR
ncbi:MAG: hypothetical protein U9P42_01520 [Candidatus Fermentibacteria bacterium]|nr:hypothetical protein [Candidatus Fermentibacteria bacterium]